MLQSYQYIKFKDKACNMDEETLRKASEIKKAMAFLRNPNLSEVTRNTLKQEIANNGNPIEAQKAIATSEEVKTDDLRNIENIKVAEQEAREQAKAEAKAKEAAEKQKKAAELKAKMDNSFKGLAANDNTLNLLNARVAKMPQWDERETNQQAQQLANELNNFASQGGSEHDSTSYHEVLNKNTFYNQLVDKTALKYLTKATLADSAEKITNIKEDFTQHANIDNILGGEPANNLQELREKFNSIDAKNPIRETPEFAQLKETFSKLDAAEKKHTADKDNYKILKKDVGLLNSNLEEHGIKIGQFLNKDVKQKINDIAVEDKVLPSIGINALKLFDADHNPESSGEKSKSADSAKSGSQSHTKESYSDISSSADDAGERSSSESAKSPRSRSNSAADGMDLASLKAANAIKAKTVENNPPHGLPGKASDHATKAPSSAVASAKQAPSINVSGPKL
jgi:hypothetical protein